MLLLATLQGNSVLDFRWAYASSSGCGAAGRVISSALERRAGHVPSMNKQLKRAASAQDQPLRVLRDRLAAKRPEHLPGSEGVPTGDVGFNFPFTLREDRIHAFVLFGQFLVHA